MKLPVKQGFDLEAFRAGVPAVTRDGNIEVFDKDIEGSLITKLGGVFSYEGKLDLNGKGEVGVEKFDLVAMLDFGGHGDEGDRGGQRVSDEELLAWFVCAVTAGRRIWPENAEEKEKLAFDYLDFSEALLDEYKRRLVKRGLTGAEAAA